MAVYQSGAINRKRLDSVIYTFLASVDKAVFTEKPESKYLGFSDLKNMV